MRNSELMEKLENHSTEEYDLVGVIIEIGGQDLPRGHNQIIIGYYDNKGEKTTIETRDDKILNYNYGVGDVLEFNLDTDGNFNWGAPIRE